MRLKQLDVLRGVAILLVLGRHVGDFPAGFGGPASAVLGLWEHIGWLGVDLFFVLSGFLVSGLLFSEYKKRGALDCKRFLLRRGFKIYPPFYFLIGITVLVRLFVLGKDIPWPSYLVEGLYLQNYFPDYQLWGPTWSLAVEEHFYLGLPLLLLLLARRGGPDPFRRLPLIVACLAAAVLIARSSTVWAVQGVENGVYAAVWRTHLRVDALLFGVLLSYLEHFRPGFGRGLVRFGTWPLWAGAAVLLVPVFLARDLFESPAIQSWGLTSSYLAFGLVLIACLRAPADPLAARIPGASLLARGAAWIGFYSYSIYLWHMPVRSWGLKFLEGGIGFELPFALRAFVFMAGSLAVGALLARLIETPVLALRDRFFPSRSGAAVASVVQPGPSQFGIRALTPSAPSAGTSSA